MPLLPLNQIFILSPFFLSHLHSFLWSMPTPLPVLSSSFSPILHLAPLFHFFTQTVVFSAFRSSQSHKASSHAVRFRVCQLINKLLGSMAENAQIDDDLFDHIHQAMLVRVTDKFPNVRIQAALAMTRLQQPKDPDCPTINGLFFLFYSSYFLFYWPTILKQMHKYKT